MAKFIFTGTITVEGSDVMSRVSAARVLQTMLNDYEDMNKDIDASVTIHWDKVERVPKSNPKETK